MNYYHPKKEKWLEVDLQQPCPLREILTDVGIPVGEIHLIVINGENTDLESSIISDEDEVKLYPAVGGG